MAYIWVSCQNKGEQFLSLSADKMDAIIYVISEACRGAGKKKAGRGQKTAENKRHLIKVRIGV